MTLRVFSSGGGQQSTAALVLAARGEIDYPIFLFANVGPESENPATLAYTYEVAMPYAKKHGIEFIEIAKSNSTLYQAMTSGKRGYLIPAFFIAERGKNKGKPTRAPHRQCTASWKIEVVDKWLREHGAKETGAIVGLGISADETDRVKPNVDPDTMAWKDIAWPLLYEAQGAPLDRQDCINIMESEGLPIAPGSACTYCPHHKLAYWQRMRTNDPAEFKRHAALELLLGDQQVANGQPRVYFTRTCKPLTSITTEEFNQPELFGDMCGSGSCMV